MSPLDKTWRDELIVMIWAIPLLGIFIPGVESYIIAGWEKLKGIDPEAPKLFIWGWGIIFAATFGSKAVTGLFRHSKFATLVSAMGGARPDVPDDAAREVNDETMYDYGVKRLAPTEDLPLPVPGDQGHRTPQKEPVDQ